MKKIIGYLKDYFLATNKIILLFASLFTAVLIFINYHFGLSKTIYRFGNLGQYFGWYFVFLTAFSYGYFLQVLVLKSVFFKNKKFLFLLLMAPAIFAWKMSFAPDFTFSTEEKFY